ncbi:MAG: flagellar basal body rod protein FlgB [Gammaproteobacteria bacterium]|nr:flagellar basal body rod protein FlgB [Gammaproteobacteria bacterium]NNF61193.1 flagellar basal body rod protein FlgB [Gammaproteobacteria bacterium]NNM19942.1 flagellar basal body rod protein FlgB [Gammaproteobacteria bacterium]
MAFSFDTALGIHPQAVMVRSRRMQVIASNLANADTPGYQARDLDFREMLRSESSGARIMRTHARHLDSAAAGNSAGGELKYRNPLQPSVDGNTVEPQFEQAAFADNAIRYQASLRFLEGRIRSLSDAITGGLR